MKTLIFTLIIFLAGVPMMSAADADGFELLFNGKDLDNWEQKGGKAKYEIKDGAIVGTTVPNTANSFLCTKKQYA